MRRKPEIDAGREPPRSSLLDGEGPRKAPESLKLIEASALWPRLRAGLGVGAKADLLVFLLGLRGGWASSKVISWATGYTTVTIRTAAGEMALARLIREAQGRPTEYLAPARPWADLLGLRDGGDEGASEPAVPHWRFWAEIFAFLAGTIAWSGIAEVDTAGSKRVIPFGTGARVAGARSVGRLRACVQVQRDPCPRARGVQRDLGH